MCVFMMVKLSHEAATLGLTQSEKCETILKLRQNKGRFGGANRPHNFFIYRYLQYSYLVLCLIVP